MSDPATQRELDLRLAAMEKALDLARKQLEQRLDAMNEFRAQLRDQNATFVTRTEYEIIVQQLRESVRSLELSRAELQGKASQESVARAQIMGVIGIVIGLLGILSRFI
ncbi:MAG TPA: hypothetical protein PK406_00555 [Verrucomicrobiota bacterium]|nr:hypothetical protein [Verrucomicrobiota bacterium]